jgi:hypothetical protein
VAATSPKIQPQRLGVVVNSQSLTRASTEISALRCLKSSHHFQLIEGTNALPRMSEVRLQASAPPFPFYLGSAKEDQSRFQGDGDVMHSVGVLMNVRSLR